MAEVLVPDVLTAVDPSDVYDGLWLLWPTLAPDYPAGANRRASVLVLAAQWALETAGGHAVHCFNLGNAKHMRGDGHKFCQFACGEEIPTRYVNPGPLVQVVATYEREGESWSSVKYLPPHPATSFLAFGTFGEGLSYWALAFRGRWRAAWPSVVAGDVPGFAHALHSDGYCTAAEDGYRDGMLRWLHQLAAIIPESHLNDGPTAPVLPDVEG